MDRTADGYMAAATATTHDVAAGLVFKRKPEYRRESVTVFAGDPELIKNEKVKKRKLRYRRHLLLRAIE